MKNNGRSKHGTVSLFMTMSTVKMKELHMNTGEHWLYCRVRRLQIDCKHLENGRWPLFIEWIDSKKNCTNLKVKNDKWQFVWNFIIISSVVNLHSFFFFRFFFFFFLGRFWFFMRNDLCVCVKVIGASFIYFFYGHVF